MKPSSIARAPLALAVAVGATFFALPVSAQDGAAPPPGEALNPWQAPAQTTPPAPAPPPETLPEPAHDSDEVPSAAPERPSPGLTFLESKQGAAPAPARADEKVEEPDDGKLRYHQDHLLAFAGFRIGKIESPGFDPFADSDELIQFSLGLGKTVMTAGNFSVAGLFLYDIGGRSSEARGAQSELWVHRLTLGAEGRYHFFRQLFVFGRVAPGAIHSIAKLEDPSAGVEDRAARTWVFATDLSAGATLELSGWSGSSRTRQLGAWITLDGGYGFAGESELSLAADGGDGPERSEPVDLGPLALSGPFMRAAVVVTY